MHSCRDNLHERVCETQCMFLKSELSQAESLWMSHHAVGWHIGTDVLDVTPHCRVAYRDRCALRYGVRAAAGPTQHRRSQDGQAPRDVYFFFDSSSWWRKGIYSDSSKYRYSVFIWWMSSGRHRKVCGLPTTSGTTLLNWIYPKRARVLTGSISQHEVDNSWQIHTKYEHRRWFYGLKHAVSRWLVVMSSMDLRGGF